MPLEEHYSGDKAWAKFLSLHETQPMSGEKFRAESFSTLGELSDHAIGVLTVAVSLDGLERTRDWLVREIPALDGLTPLQCISQDASRELRMRIRECLMRSPV
jgi:hypothetical protein